MGKDKTRLDLNGEGLMGRSREIQEQLEELDEEEGEEGEEGSPSSAAILDKLSKLDESIQGEAGVARLLRIPGVVDAIRQHQEGGSGRPGTKPPVKEVEEEEEEDIDINELDNKGLAKYVTKVLTREVSKTLSKQKEELDSQLQQLTGYVQKQHQQTLEQQIAEVREKYPDFDDHRAEMIQLSNENPSLAVEELYILSKVRKGSPIVKDSTLESERPEDGPSRTARVRRTGREVPVAPGRAGFKQLLNRTPLKIDSGE